VSCDNITDMGILALLPLTSLGSLCLQRCTLLTDRALASLIHLPNLHTLNIGQVAGISDDGIGLLARGMPRLRNLSLQACSNITGSPPSVSSLLFSELLKGSHDFSYHQCWNTPRVAFLPPEHCKLIANALFRN
jgi:hypothetical protein